VGDPRSLWHEESSSRSAIDAASFNSSIFSGKSHDAAIELSELKRSRVSRLESAVRRSGSEANDMQISSPGMTMPGDGPKRRRSSRASGLITVSPSQRIAHRPALGACDFDCVQYPAYVVPDYTGFGEAGESEDQFTDRMARDLGDLIQKEDPIPCAAYLRNPIMGAGASSSRPR